MKIKYNFIVARALDYLKLPVYKTNSLDRLGAAQIIVAAAWPKATLSAKRYNKYRSPIFKNNPQSLEAVESSTIFPTEEIAVYAI